MMVKQACQTSERRVVYKPTGASTTVFCIILFSLVATLSYGNCVCDNYLLYVYWVNLRFIEQCRDQQIKLTYVFTRGCYGLVIEADDQVKRRARDSFITIDEITTPYPVATTAKQRKTILACHHSIEYSVGFNAHARCS